MEQRRTDRLFERETVLRRENVEADGVFGAVEKRLVACACGILFRERALSSQVKLGRRFEGGFVRERREFARMHADVLLAFFELRRRRTQLETDARFLRWCVALGAGGVVRRCGETVRGRDEAPRLRGRMECTGERSGRHCEWRREE